MTTLRRSRHHWILPIVLFAALAAPMAWAATPKEIDDAINKAKAFLYSEQKGNNWEVVPHRDLQGWPNDQKGGQWGGRTALVTYALLSAGDSPKDGRLEKAISFLKEAELVGTYARGFRANVWQFCPDVGALHPLVHADAKWILDSVRNYGNTPGFYTYVPTVPMRTDSSNSQLAVLGMWACAEILQEYPPESYWKTIDAGWRTVQNTDGGWSYNDGGPNGSSVSMTAAGLATLYICVDELNRNDGKCNGNQDDDAINRGLKWMSDHYESDLPQMGIHTQYALYASERAGVASGRKYFGKVDWYQYGCDLILKTQRPNGAFQDWDFSVPDTAMTLLFLIRGRAAVAINKLDYTPDPESNGPRNGPAATNWDERPRDAAKLVKFMGRQVEGDWLNWQIVTLKPPVEELHDAPILYIAGNQPLNFTTAEEAKIKDFIEQGGLVVFNSDCASDAFVLSVKHLGARLFPIPGEFRELPEDHPIFSEQFRSSAWKLKPKLLGLTNGVRELMIIVPTADPAKWWQLDAVASHSEMFQLGSNIYLYSIDRQPPRYKGLTYWVTPTGSGGTPLKLARIQYNGAWNPEPGGWRRLAAIMQNKDGIALDVQTVELGKGQLAGFTVAHLTGAVSCKLSDAARAELKAFVEGGGKLIIDAAGGSAKFDQSIKAELKTIWPDAAGQLDEPLPPDHAVYGGQAFVANSYRSFARRTLQGDFTKPRMRGMQIKGRLAVLYSAEDLSGGLVGQSMDGICGYEPPFATDLMERMILFDKK